jgi:hypothetical protein
MNYTPKNQLRVGGKMSEQGADKAGITLAQAAKTAAWLLGLSALIIAIGYALPAIASLF